MFNVQCFFYAYFKITIGRIDHFETITWVVVFTGCAWWQVFFDRRRWSAMFLYSCDQMSDSFANIGRICITQTCKLIYDIGLQGHRGMALQGKIIFHFEWGEHDFNVNAIVINARNATYASYMKSIQTYRWKKLKEVTNQNILDIFGSNTTLDRSTKHPGSTRLGFWTYDLKIVVKIVAIHFMSLRCLL